MGFVDMAADGATATDTQKPAEQTPAQGDAQAAKSEQVGSEDKTAKTGNWHTSLKTEYREHPSVKNSKDFGEWQKRAIAALDKADRPVYPGKDASEEIINEYRNAVGIPQSADGYEVDKAVPKEMLEGNADYWKAVAQLAHEVGMPKETFSEFAGILAESNAATYKQVSDLFEESRKAETKKAEDNYRTIWKKEHGGKAVENNTLATQAFTALVGGEDAVKAIIEEGGEGALRSPTLMNALFKHRAKFIEGGMVQSMPSGKPTPGKLDPPIRKDGQIKFV